MAKPHANPVDVSLVRETLDYNPETGEFAFKYRRPGKTPKQVGWADSRGYRYVRFGQQKYTLHRCAWAIVHGYWPAEIDHINGDTTDNRISNLRLANRSQNSANRKAYGKSGYKGVVAVKHGYMAQLTTQGKRIGLGIHKTAEAAHAAYVAAASKAHGEYFRAN